MLPVAFAVELWPHHILPELVRVAVNFDLNIDNRAGEDPTKLVRGCRILRNCQNPCGDNRRKTNIF